MQVKNKNQTKKTKKQKKKNGSRIFFLTFILFLG